MTYYVIPSGFRGIFYTQSIIMSSLRDFLSTLRTFNFGLSAFSLHHELKPGPVNILKGN